MLPHTKTGGWTRGLDSKKQAKRDRSRKFAVSADLMIGALSRVGYEARRSGTDFVLARCMFHSDRSPSLSIRSHGRYARCFSAGCQAHPDNEGPMDWLDICEKIGITDGLISKDSDGSEQVVSVQHRLKSLRQMAGHGVNRDAQGGNDWPRGARLWTKRDGGWRGLPASFLIKRQVRYWDHRNCELYDKSKATVPRLVLPVIHTVGGEMVGWVAEAIEDEHRNKYLPGPSKKRSPTAAKPKCFNMPGMSAERVLFGLAEALDMIEEENLRGLVLTEGPYDELRCCYYGIPAASVLGTGTWKSRSGGLSYKGRLIVESGVEVVYLLMDADSAGDDCADLIEAELGGWVTVKRIRLPRGKDPGNVREKILQRISRNIRRAA